jgi:hypothetical protein
MQRGALSSTLRRPVQRRALSMQRGALSSAALHGALFSTALAPSSWTGTSRRLPRSPGRSEGGRVNSKSPRHSGRGAAREAMHSGPCTARERGRPCTAGEAQRPIHSGQGKAQRARRSEGGHAQRGRPCTAREAMRSGRGTAAKARHSGRGHAQRAMHSGPCTAREAMRSGRGHAQRARPCTAGAAQRPGALIRRVARRQAAVRRLPYAGRLPAHSVASFSTAVEPDALGPGGL